MSSGRVRDPAHARLGDRRGGDRHQPAQVVLGDRQRGHQHDHVAERSDHGSAPARGKRRPGGRGAPATIRRASSIPTIIPRCLTSATAGSTATRCSSSRDSIAIFGASSSSVRSRSNVSSVAIAAAQASGLPVNVWPWKKVRELVGAAEESVVDALGRQRRGEREVAAGQALADAQQVGRDALVLAGEHASRCGRSRSRPRRRSAARRADRTARAPARR